MRGRGPFVSFRASSNRAFAARQTGSVLITAFLRSAETATETPPVRFSGGLGRSQVHPPPRPRVGEHGLEFRGTNQIDRVSSPGRLEFPTPSVPSGQNPGIVATDTGQRLPRDRTKRVKSFDKPPVDSPCTLPPTISGPPPDYPCVRNDVARRRPQRLATSGR